MSEPTTVGPHPVVDEPLRAGVARTGAGVVEVTGDDRVSYLHNVLSQDVAGLGSGTARGALHLDQKGAPLAALDLVVLPARILLVAPTVELAAETADHLGSRTFLADARFTVSDLALVALRGEEARSLAGEAGFEVEAGQAVEADDVVAIGRDDGLDVVTPPDRLDEISDRLADAGARRIDSDVLEAWRIERGEPAWAHEIRRPHLPEEAGLLPTHVHLDKGCYPGQEAVARMWMLGRPRRRLARVRLAEDVDAGFTSGKGREQIEVTSAATYAGDRVGLAYVPANTAPGDRFADGRVTVRDLVGDGPVPGAGEGVVRRRDRRDGAG